MHLTITKPHKEGTKEMTRGHYDASRAKMRMDRSARAYNSLLEELGQVYFEAGCDAKVNRVLERVRKLRPALEKLCKRFYKGA